MPAFGKQIRGFDRDDAVLTGVETRTSSPVRITRDNDTLQSLNVRGLYPCGEGAGYAGGILSAGVDGIKVAEAVRINVDGEQTAMSMKDRQPMKFDDIKKLHQKKYREEFRHFLVEGEHLVLELQKAAVKNPLLQGSKLYVTSEHEHWRSPFETHVVSDRRMAEMAETKTPQGIIALVPMLPGHRTTQGRARHLSARNSGPGQSRHDTAHAGLVRKFPLPAQPRQRRSV